MGRMLHWLQAAGTLNKLAQNATGLVVKNKPDASMDAGC